jgi:gluconokinase
VDSQFEALEDPSGEAGVLSLDATRPIDALAAEADAWMLTQTFLKAGVQ